MQSHQLRLETITPSTQEQQPQTGDVLHIGEIWSCVVLLHIREIKSCLHNNVTIVYLQEVDRGVEPLAVDHCAVPDSGEALGGAQHQGVLHPHTGKHLEYRV